jgi:hypothetical protein
MKISTSELQEALCKLPDPQSTERNVLFVHLLEKRTRNADYMKTLVFDKQETEDGSTEWALNTSFC